MSTSVVKFASSALHGDVSIAELKTFPGISAQAFQLPDDRKATQAVQQVPLFPQIIKAIYGGFIEKVARYQQITNAIRLGPNQGRAIYRLFVRAAEILDVKTLPELYLSGDFSLNANAFGMNTYMITLYAPLVAMLSEGELMAIIAHELGHVKCAHMANKTLAYYLGTFGAEALRSWIPVLGSMAAAGLTIPLMHWSRMAELSCDRAALLVVQDPNIVAGALSKLAGWSVAGLGELNLDDIDAQLHEYEHADQGTLDSVAKISHSVNTLLDTHPLPLLRIKKIKQWAASDQYSAIVSGTYPKEELTKIAAGNVHCHACGQVTREGDPFCSTCGAPLVISAVVVLCSNEACKSPLKPGDRFCPRCGTKVANA